MLRVGLLVVVAVSSYVQLEPMRSRSAKIRAEHARPDRIAKATYPRHAGFERLLRKAVIGSEGRVFVGARFALWSDLGRSLNTHQVGLLEGTDHAPVFDLAALDRLFAEQEFSRMYVWQHPFDDNFEHLLRSHYREVGTLGTDPLAGHEVSIWEPIVRGQPAE